MMSDTTSRSSLRVLHVEDNATDAELTRFTLSGEWPECSITRVETRNDLQAALRRSRYDVILSDFSMPSFDGLKALELARELQPATPYIFFSGTIGEENAVKALQQGATDYVIKDRPGRLVPSIRKALERVENDAGRVRAEEALRENQDRFRQITENVADLIAVIDLDGRRVYNNPAYRAVLGDPEALRGTDAFADVHPDDLDRLLDTFDETVRTGVGWRTDHRFIALDGSIRYVESRGNVLRHADGRVANVLVVSRDVTERRAAESKLRNQGSFLDKARDAIIATDLEHRITYWNASAERIYGWAAADVLGFDLREIGLGFDATRFAVASSQVAAKFEWRDNFSLRNRKGDILQIDSTWSLVSGSDGGPDSVLIIDTDVTEKRKLETQLLRADRMESIGMLAGGVARDLNNAFAPVVMGAELLRVNPTDPRNIPIIETIERSAKHGTALVQQLLTFARGGEAELLEVHVGALIDDTEKLFRQGLPNSIVVTSKCARALFPIHANATQIKQVLINLLTNAKDALPFGGKVEIKAENTTVSSELAGLHRGTKPGPYVRISVKDNGTGISPPILERIFDPFFTTKRIGKGTGLGLSIVAGIVRNHGGFISVESQVGKGTEFQLFLPALFSFSPPRERRAADF
jgi:PAS domain S-box-containing protein